MPKNKQQKKKDRERRVAKKKLAEAEKRAEQQSATDKESDRKLPRAKKIMTGAALPKTSYVPSNRKSPFTHRRSGG